MADENVTASENTTETNEQAATPATQASKPAVPKRLIFTDCVLTIK
mgnify:CR=1 FL=1